MGSSFGPKGSLAFLTQLAKAGAQLQTDHTPDSGLTTDQVGLNHREERVADDISNDLGSGKLCTYASYMHCIAADNMEERFPKPEASGSNLSSDMLLA